MAMFTLNQKRVYKDVIRKENICKLAGMHKPLGC